MSRAIELAKECDAQDSRPLAPHEFSVHAYTFTEASLEAFSHAARAEALREAAEKYHGVYVCCCDVPFTGGDLGSELRAMADREGE